MKFEHGYYVNSEVSNYSNYRLKKFEDLAKDLSEYLLDKKSRILDFGAATGGLVSALRNIGYINIIGTDISYWAIEQGRVMYHLDKNVLQHYNRQLLEDSEIIIMLDVLEHISDEELNKILSLLKSSILILRIPVTKKEGEDFVLDISKNDKTHIQIHCKEWWSSILNKYGYTLKTYLNSKSIYDSEGVLAAIYIR